jgi:LysM repeat protein
LRRAKLKTKNITSKPGRGCANKLMNNPNPFVPKGSLLEQQSQRRFRLKFAVGCVLVVSVTGLVAMLIGGCKREQPPVDNNPPPVVDTSTNLTPVTDTNLPPVVQSNTVSIPVPVPPAQVLPAPVPAVDAGSTEYVVVAGDTLAKIAKAHGVTLKALEAANPGVDPKKLKIKQKLVIPAATKSADVAAPAVAGATDAGGELYTVKSGDTLAKIAKTHGTTVKLIQAANNLTTTKIMVGHKLKLPVKAEAATPAPAVQDTTAAPALPPVSTPAPSVPAPAPVK